MNANPKCASVIEYAAAAEKGKLPLWPWPGKDLEIMRRVKEMFDPQKLLNRDRFYRLF
jgi:FAD/FMN-containing dehydrogenase